MTDRCSYPTSTAPPFTFSTSPEMNPASGVHKKQHRPGNLPRARHAAHRNAGGNLPALARRRQRGGRHIRGHPPRRHTVYPDPLRRQFARQALCETDERAFRHGIVGVVGLAALPRRRADQHDMSRRYPRPMRRSSAAPRPAAPSAPPPPAPARTPSPDSRPASAAIAPRPSAQSARLRPPTRRDSRPECPAARTQPRPSRPAPAHRPACSAPARSPRTVQCPQLPAAALGREGLGLLPRLPVAERNPRPGLRKQPHRLRADSARPAGDERNFTVEVQRNTCHRLTLKHFRRGCRGNSAVGEFEGRPY